ncbi:phospholipase D-like domain-containing protein DpdK [Streptomyces sporangiiformans]|uniref:Phosphatidylserine/phosphatidylglycerophosphate/ cardiolipin synthase family protein n=1 Tax=Streptomyces sporangiiformans TaxID=2315329 RepID=A0A505D2E7_9ACTN|nr:phospholipase D-like domain-containing protein DpdK [Streptomyces sporangiiformans]TPQ18633.1 phosphatidylserine/phosphatidylglycerophosphate/cardiolipin synthase family protein [Streptomyces sporangiiformans]
MTVPSRTLRTNGRSALRADSLIRTALLAQLAAPGGEVWLVSAWVSDVDLVDNADCSFDYLLGEDPPVQCRLSDLLLMLARSGTAVRVVTQGTQANTIFLERLALGRDERTDLEVFLDDNVHEKSLVGPGWMFNGSMNFTRNGLARNKEQISYALDEQAAAQAVMDYQHEWMARGV